MAMKDKLEKFGHKRGFYAARSTFFGFLGCLLVFSMVAIPTYIASKAQNVVPTAASVEDEEEDDTEIETIVEDM